MLDLKQGECKSWNIKVAEQRLFIKGLKQVSNIIYAEIKASKKDCLCKYLRILPGLLEQRNKYNILYIKVLLEAIFLGNNSSKQKNFHLSARELYDECSASISVEIICFKHLQQVSYEKLDPGTF